MSLKVFNSNTRQFWISISLITVLMNAAALYFQHIMNLDPCSRCIDQRVSIYIITASAIFTSLTIKHRYLFHTLKILTLVSLGFASYITIAHYLVTIDPNPFAISCSLRPNLPSWLPLHEWVPSLFSATGACGETHIKFLNMGLVQWSAIVTTALTIYAIALTFHTYIRALVRASA